VFYVSGQVVLFCTCPTGQVPLKVNVEPCVCMYVCMYTYMYACMHVCIQGSTLTFKGTCPVGQVKNKTTCPGT